MKEDFDDLFQEKLHLNTYVGEIVDNDDPEYMGRCKIKVYNKFDDLEKDDMPWCYPAGYHMHGAGKIKGGGNFSHPKKGALVKVIFFQGDLYAPEYYSHERLMDKIKDWIKDSYENSHVVLWDEDEDVRIKYKPNPDGASHGGGRGGLTMWHKKSYINIRPNTNIDIFHSNSQSRIQLNNGDILHDSNTSMKFNTSFFHIKCSTLVIDADLITVNGLTTFTKFVAFPGGHGP